MHIIVSVMSDEDYNMQLECETSAFSSGHHDSWSLIKVNVYHEWDCHHSATVNDYCVIWGNKGCVGSVQWRSKCFLIISAKSDHSGEANSGALMVFLSGLLEA